MIDYYIIAAVAALSMLVNAFMLYKIINLESDWRADNAQWLREWNAREKEYNAGFANRNVDPSIDPFSINDTMPGAGEFAHLVEDGQMTFAEFSDPRWKGSENIAITKIPLDVNENLT